MIGNCGGVDMNYNELIKLYKNNEFRKIDEQSNATKFYMLRSISKSKTLNAFCEKFSLDTDLNQILHNEDITVQHIKEFIKETFNPKTIDEIKDIERELNKLQNFDWGGSAGNNLEKNIVNNYIKKMVKYEELEEALQGNILRSVYGYTMNSWYNHWSTIMIEDIFKNSPKVLPTVDLIEKIDFFIDDIPYDLKVTYFPEELMKEKISTRLLEMYDSKSELTCLKRFAKKADIAIPNDLKGRELTICLYNLLCESVDTEAKKFIDDLNKIKKDVVNYYKNNPNELIVWLYENQGEMRFDAANRLYVVLIDSERYFDSWKLKRNMNLIKDKILSKVNEISSENKNFINFHWKKDDKQYACISEVLFIDK